MPVLKQARSGSTVVKAGLVVLMVVTGCKEREEREVAELAITMPPIEDMSADSAEMFYVACMDTMQLFPADFRAVPSGHVAKPKHPDLELVTREATANGKFTTLYDHATLVGVIDNKKSSTSHNKFDDKWTQGPPGKSCVYIGGDESRLRARVVSKNGGTYFGQYREVAARWHADPHGAASACWDQTPDDTETPGNKECTGTMAHTFTGEAAFGAPDTTGEDPAMFGGNLAKRILTGGSGPWYTCSQYTCCKPL